MQRSSFFRSLATLIVAPKIFSQIDWAKAIAKTKVPVTGYFNDLQILIPKWYPEMMEKYSDANYLTLLDAMGSEDIKTPFKFRYLNTKKR